MRLLLNEGADEKAATALVRDHPTRLCAEHRCTVPDVAFEFGPPELHPESRKLRRVIRAFDNPDAV